DGHDPPSWQTVRVVDGDECGGAAAYGSYVTRRFRAEDPAGDVRLPLGALPATNGQYVPDRPTRRDLDVGATALRHADEAARGAGMDRPRSVHTAGGVAPVLATTDLAARVSSSRAGTP